MSTSKAIDRICIIAVVFALLISVLFMNGPAFGIQAQAKAMGYEDRLFDTSKVHTIDIVIDDWDAFLQTAQSEEYSVCSVVIDGEAFKNVGIRGKGNTSLSTVSSMNSDRYSFKIEFDQYDSTKSYYGLDKLSLNNLIQDNTMMKDYLTYQMMNEFGAAAPLCSYVYITVNGEDWGLYLAVEAVEESFLQRNYGNDYGDLYKPDSMNMGGGRGNGKDFDFEDFMGSSDSEDSSGSTMPSMPGGGMWPSMGGDSSEMPTMPEGFDPSQMGGMMPGQSGSWEQQSGQTPPDASTGAAQQGGFDPSQMGGMIPGGMGSGETKLQYIDDDPDSYSTIFSSAKTDITTADQTRLIAALKDLSEGKESAVDAEAVIRYFVVHNFVVNGDSYTGSMIHNYYLYEDDGQLSMIPWDYNLAFGTFQGNNASSAVNDDIDSPLSVTGSDRPMIDWIFSSEEYTQLYHQHFREFLNTVDVQSIINNAKTLIAPYVEKDPTKFCTYEEFEKGVETLSTFCDLRSQSVAQQLAGNDANVDASVITLSDMGTMNHGGGFGDKGQRPGSSGDNADTDNTGTQIPSMPDNTSGSGNSPMPQMPAGQGGMQMPGQNGTPNNTSGTDNATDGNQQFPNFDGQGGMTPPEGMEMPEGMENMFPGQNGNSQSRFPNRGQTGDAPTQEANQWVLLVVTVAVLAAGLLFAFKYKR